jgi:hypothetical protein
MATQFPDKPGVQRGAQKSRTFSNEFPLQRDDDRAARLYK